MATAYARYMAYVLTFGSNGTAASHIRLSSSYEIVFWRTLIGGLFLVLAFAMSGQKVRASGSRWVWAWPPSTPQDRLVWCYRRPCVPPWRFPAGASLVTVAIITGLMNGFPVHIARGDLLPIPLLHAAAMGLPGEAEQQPAPCGIVLPRERRSSTGIMLDGACSGRRPTSSPS
jgi:hypothetical protein